jgi:DNA-binding NtrC family response regulator
MDLAMNHTILLIDANQSEAESVEQVLRCNQYDVIRVASPRDASKFIPQSVGLVICDLPTEQEPTFQLLQDWGQRFGCPSFIFMIDAGDVQSAVDVMKHGAADCLVKPIDPQKLRERASATFGSGAGERTRSVTGFSGEGEGPNSRNGNQALDIPAGTSLEDLERAAVQHALVQHLGNRTHAARELGISVRTLQRKLKVWRLPILTLHHYSPVPVSIRPR